MSSNRIPLKRPATSSRLLVLILSAAVVGCGSNSKGPRRVAANGIVSLDGQPLENGTIRFIPTGGTEGPKVSVAIINGFFQFPQEVGPVVGHHRVEIEAPEAGEFALDDEEALQRLQQQGRKAKVEVLRIPAVYNKNSQLTADLSEAGPNDLAFELVSRQTTERM
ncbi:hypothetical protein [Fuerstiella marisgermanici]|uniref:Carboxypeptidase regulatory-like domain-containing protein n=1 Tax=Fuerstiella marisgermanici TaxID=1891926 RepID=A0A1P8WDV6_9PLAN|nr:hypothetical protein [Fuerstiella marisgermanici]APZ92221.1 hypothetical protein Fuma_01830 [Fuerstiella marisgermanici]